MGLLSGGFYSQSSSQPPTDVVTLSGVIGTPNVTSDNGTDPQCGWQFRANGSVWQMRSNSADTQFQDGTEWNDNQDLPNDDFWIRFTEETFEGDGSRAVNPGTNWLKVSGSGSANRGFEADDITGTGPTVWKMKVEIAEDSGGSSIVATGYYEAEPEDDT